jgi:hypothetical protein
MPLTTPAERGASFGDRYEGLIGFGPHAIGISEDIWAVIQAAHNALGLGYPVKFHRSQALWHKIRETWSHAEWLAAFPRWSGGYVQMMLDPLMQRINDAGPLSVFAKEIRANGGRFFLVRRRSLEHSADATGDHRGCLAFVQILIRLWNLGLVMNQVLTALGFIACLEATGFNRLTGLVGVLGAGILVGTNTTLVPFGLLSCWQAFWAAACFVWSGRWLYYRGRDLVLFGHNWSSTTLGQVVATKSGVWFFRALRPTMPRPSILPSAAGLWPREDRPFDKYQISSTCAPWFGEWA